MLSIRRREVLCWPALLARAAGNDEAKVLDLLERRARAALAAIPRAETARDVERQRATLRRKLKGSLGHRRLPWPSDLQARITGVVDRGDHRIEKVVFQSLPGTMVPAHLYLPAHPAKRHPAILFYNGHWRSDSKARPDFQSFCINMARLGFVVLNFDPFGQGERGVSRRDHMRTEGLLVGVSQQGYAVHESRCALEYLLARQEVDPERIGMTGASGGGYNTWMMSALDERIKAAAPVVGTCEFYEQMAARRPRDWDPSDHCHYVPGLMTYANNHELLAMVAPRPLLIVAATDDSSFPIAGVRQVADYGRGLYKSFGVPEKMSFFEDDSAGHGFQKRKREAAYGWFLRWLMSEGNGGPRPEPPTETLPVNDPQLRCFPNGNRPAGPGMVAAAQKIARALRRPSNVPSLAELEGILGKLPPLPRSHGRVTERLTIPSEPGLEVVGLLSNVRSSGRRLVLAVDDRGKEAAVQDAPAGGWAVCGIDPRGIGELSTTKPTWTFAGSLLLGENFVWRQAWDLLQAARYLTSSGEFDRIAVYARGHNSCLAATYFVAQAELLRPFRLAGFVLEDGFASFRQFLERPKSLAKSFPLYADDSKATFDRVIPPFYFPFNALRSFDLPQLLAMSGTKGLAVNPIDGDWERMDASAARRLYPRNVQVIGNPAPGGAIRETLTRIFT